jgi:single-strand DNA-binding protein
MAYHRIEFAGRLTRDPELKFTSTGKAVCRLSVAVNDRVQKNGEWEDDPTFYDVQLWEKYAETMADKLNKGDLIMVSGRPKVETYERRDGTTGISCRVLFPQIETLSRRTASANTASHTEQASTSDTFDPNEEVPF